MENSNKVLIGVDNDITYKSLDQIMCQQSRQHMKDECYSSLFGLKGT